MNLVLLLFSILVFLGYNIPIARKYGIQKSISDTIKVLDTPIKKSFYSLFMVGISFPIMIVSDNVLGVLAGAFLCFDAAAPAGGDTTQQWVHNIGANGGIALGMAMLIYYFHEPTLPFLFLAFCIYADKLKNPTYWREVAAFIVIIVDLFILKVL